MILYYVQNNHFVHCGGGGAGEEKRPTASLRSVRLGTVTRDEAGWVRQSAEFGIKPTWS